MSAETVAIDRLGAQGDGIAETAGGPVYVPFALPGETAAIAREQSRGTLMALRSRSLERVDPPCPHFGPDGIGGTCGGCNIQHLALPAYETWKRNLVTMALRAEKIDAPIATLFGCEPGSRRRLVLTARRTDAGLLVGFNQAGSHHIVAIETCLVGDPRIVKNLRAVRRVAAAVAKGTKPFRLTVLASETGLDIAADEVGRLSERQRQGAIETVLGERVVARLALDGEVLVEPRKPSIVFGQVTVSPPPAAFLQASASAEAHMADLVSAHLSGCKRIADLFSGCGTFALRLASHAAVHAAEFDGKALAALDAGFRHATGLKRVTIERRDLFRRPLMATELKAFDGVVFDPPRAGAEAQCAELARSNVRRIAAVSCNPATLARDLALLVAGGFRVETIHPIDQFLWSPHVEAVALLAR